MVSRKEEMVPLITDGKLAWLDTRRQIRTDGLTRTPAGEGFLGLLSRCLDMI